MYDSRADTLDHVNKVQDYMKRAIDNLAHRAITHDASKLVDPEKAAWDEATPKLAELTYGTEEYRASLREIRPAVDHHYQHNDHHPEYYATGIYGMSLLALIEMLCDWKAASERTKNGDLMGSLPQNQKRFQYSDELAAILDKTARELGF
jgi:hypothetical protein